MSSPIPPPNQLPPSMGPGARPIQPGENPGNIIKEIAEVRSHYTINLESEAVTLGYDINGSTRSFRLPFDTIPVSGLAKTMCFGGPNSARVTGILVLDILRGAENILGRPVTQKEAEGFTLHSSKRMLWQFAGNGLSVVAGLGMAYRGTNVMKFPFMKPKDPAKYQNFPNRYIPILRGQYARVMWQITRANVYVIVALFMINPFFRSIGDTSMTVGLYRDERTKEVAKAMRGNVDRIRSNRAGAAGSKIENESRPQQTEEESNAQAFYGNSSGKHGNQTDFTSDSNFTDNTTDTGLVSDSTMRQQEAKQPSPTSWGRAKPRDDSDSASPQKSFGSSGFFDDDASPTAGNGPDTPVSQYNNRPSSGNAWENIRRGRTTPSQQPQSGTAPQQQSRDARRSEGQDFETKGDSFSFSNSDEDRQLARDEAQRDFDAMLERERRESGSGEYTRGAEAAGTGSEAPKNSGGSAWNRWRKG